MEWREIGKLRGELDQFLEAFDGCFSRSEGRAHLGIYVRGQLSDLTRKSVEPIADAAGLPPRTLQDFLAHHTWEEEQATDRLEEIVAAEHADAYSVGLIDETSFSKSGDKTSGVQRQYCGSTGKIDNCVVTVHLGYSTPEARFRCTLDSDLYLPESWANDRERCREAGIPDSVTYRPKWRIALEEIERALGNGVRFGYLTFDEGYGRVGPFLDALEAMGQRYVAEVPVDFHGWLLEPTVLSEGRYRGRGRSKGYPRLSAGSRPDNRVDRLCQYSYPMRDQVWETFHIKDGQKGPIVWQAKASCFYRKGSVPTTGERPGLPGGPLWLIVARNVLTGELKYFVSNAPAGTPLEELLRVAFSRWHIERCFQDEKGQLGLDHFECRRYIAIRRHLVITAISHLFLAQTHLRVYERGEKRPDDPTASARRRRVGRSGDMASGGSHETSAARRRLHSAHAASEREGRPFASAPAA